MQRVLSQIQFDWLQPPTPGAIIHLQSSHLISARDSWFTPDRPDSVIDAEILGKSESLGNVTMKWNLLLPVIHMWNPDHFFFF